MYMAEEYEQKTYEDLSNELQKIYPAAARAYELIPLMYNRLTLIDRLTHKNAVEKIIADHQQLFGFSARNIRRYLPSGNPLLPKRVRPPWPKNIHTETESQSQLSNTEQESNTQTELDIQDNSLILTSDSKKEGIIDFEFSLRWEDVHRYMALKFNAGGTYVKLWFHGRIQIQTGKVITASLGGISDNNYNS
jgi:hypothetical protein